jgi:hypothetical protein
MARHIIPSFVDSNEISSRASAATPTLSPQFTLLLLVSVHGHCSVILRYLGATLWRLAGSAAFHLLSIVRFIFFRPRNLSSLFLTLSLFVSPSFLAWGSAHHQRHDVHVLPGLGLFSILFSLLLCGGASNAPFSDDLCNLL